MQGLYQNTNPLGRLQLDQGAYRTFRNIEFSETQKGAPSQARLFKID